MWIKRKEIKKKLVALFLMACMVSTWVMPLTSYAADGVIKITNTPSSSGITLKGRTFNLYQVLSVNGAGTSYVLNSDFQDFFNTNATKAGANATVTEIVTYIQAQESDMESLTRLLQTYVQGNESAYRAETTTSVSESGGVETVSFTGLENGYYFVLDEATSGLSVVRVAGALTTVSGGTTLEITVKGSAPTITKENLDDNTEVWGKGWGYEVGDTVEYRLVSTIPQDITGYDVYYYMISDTLSSGLTYNTGSLAIYTDEALNNTLSGDYYTLTNKATTGDIFTIRVDIKKMHEELGNQLPTTLYIRYNADITDDAQVVGVDALTNGNTHNPNEVTLTYSDNPYDTGNGVSVDLSDYNGSTNSIDDIVYHYTFSMEVNKVDENGTDLAGAEFALYEGTTQLYLEEKSSGVYYIDRDKSATDNGAYGSNAGTIETVTTGPFTIIGLNDNVKYTLREINAPTDYNLFTEDMDFTIHSTIDSSVDGTFTSVSVTNGSSMNYISVSSDNANQLTTTVVNSKTPLLPSTGGVGAVIFQIIGVLMMCGAAGLLAYYYKKKNVT